MTTPAERLFELARDALSEQERQVEQLRRGVPPVLAAAAVAASLLTEPIFTGTHPDGAGEWLGLLLGLIAVALLLTATVWVLVPRELAFSLDAVVVHDELLDLEAEPNEFHLALAVSLRDQQAANEPTARTLRRAFNLALGALSVELAGLALAAAIAS